MDNWLTILGVTGLILSVPTAIGAALALIRSSYNKAQTEQLRGFNDDLRGRVSDLETHEKVLEGRLQHVENENSMLREMVTQRADLQKHHQVVMESYDAMSELMGRTVTTVQEILVTVKEVLKNVAAK